MKDVTCHRLLDHRGQVVQRGEVGSAKLSLDEAKTGIGGKLSVARNDEVQMDGWVQTTEHFPHEVLHHGVITKYGSTLYRDGRGLGPTHAHSQLKCLLHVSLNISNTLVDMYMKLHKHLESNGSMCSHVFKCL